MNVGRRELLTAVLLCVVGAGLALLASSRPWAHAVVREPPLPTQSVDLSGRTVAPLVAALAIVGLAAVIALAATRGRWRVTVGAVVALAGAGIVGSSATLAAADVRNGSALRERAPAAALRDALVSVQLQGWRHVAAAGGICLVAAGLLSIARGRTWATMGRRFDSPARTVAEPIPHPGTGEPTPASTPPPALTATDPVAAAAPTAPTEADMWDQIERGVDPTA